MFHKSKSHVIKELFAENINGRCKYELVASTALTYSCDVKSKIKNGRNIWEVQGDP